MRGLVGTDRGATPVIGVVLLVAIVVIVAAIVGATALDIGDRLPDGEPTNVAYFETSYDGGNSSTNATLTVTVGGGAEKLSDRAYIADSDGNRVAWDAVWTEGDTLEAGEQLVIDGVDNANGNDGALNAPCDRETYRVVEQNENNETSETVAQVTSGTANPNADNCSP